MKSQRKVLIEQYKQMKPDMGIFWIRSKGSKKCFLETSQNLKGSKTDYSEELAIPLLGIVDVIHDVNRKTVSQKT